MKEFNSICLKIKAYIGCYPSGDGLELFNDGLSNKLGLAFGESRDFDTQNGHALFDYYNLTRADCINYCNKNDFPYAGVNDG